MKITGAEFKEWYDNHWPNDPSPECFYLDDCPEMHAEDGTWTLANDEVLDTDNLGFVGWQGDGDDPRTGANDVTSYVRKWRKTLNHTFFAWLVPNEKKEEAVAALRAIGAVQVIRP